MDRRNERGSEREREGDKEKQMVNRFMSSRPRNKSVSFQETTAGPSLFNDV